MRIDPNIRPQMYGEGSEVSKKENFKKVEGQTTKMQTRINDLITAKEKMKEIISKISIQPSIAIMAHGGLDPNRISTLVGNIEG
jgi:hypothetical protein